MSNPLSTGFKGLVSYLETGKFGNQPDRVAWVEARNLPTAHPQAAARYMAATARGSVRTRKPVYHFSVSFDPSDPVDREVMRRVTDRLLRDLDLEEHQVLVFAHKDRPYQHLHFVVNRVHPERRTAWSTSWDYARRYGKLLKGLSIPYVSNTAGEAFQAYGEHVGEPSLEDLRTRVEAGIREAGVRPVIFIDDVDRLDADEIRALVRLVKLTAGFENTTYILAFDPEFVSAALATAVGGSQVTDGRRYLEKIVQVPLQLPAADQDTLFLLMLEHLNDAIRDIDVPFPESDQQAYVQYVRPLFRARRRTIRAGKRYANAAGFVLPLLAGEVNVGDLLLLEAIRTWYPDVYGRLRDHRELLIGDELGRPPLAHDSGQRADVVRAEWDRLISGLDAREEVSVREALEHLFPFVQAITRKVHYGSEWEVDWGRTQRAASRHYFERYFQYTVPRSDVSDRLIERIEIALTAGDQGSVTNWLREESQRGAADRLLEKLSVHVGTLPPIGAETLALALAATGDLYRDTGGFFGCEFPKNCRRSSLNSGAIEDH